MAAGSSDSAMQLGPDSEDSALGRNKGPSDSGCWPLLAASPTAALAVAAQQPAWAMNRTKAPGHCGKLAREGQGPPGPAGVTIGPLAEPGSKCGPAGTIDLRQMREAGRYRSNNGRVRGFAGYKGAPLSDTLWHRYAACELVVAVVARAAQASLFRVYDMSQLP
jgi:hypothetical protein